MSSKGYEQLKQISDSAQKSQLKGTRQTISQITKKDLPPILDIFKYAFVQSLARLALLPFDVLKCKNQVNTTNYFGLVKGIATLRKEGQGFLGLSPYFLKYFMFSFLTGEVIQRHQPSGPAYMLLSSALFSALLFPLMQLSQPSQAYPSSTLKAFKKIYSQKDDMKFYTNYLKFYKGFRLMVLRDIIFYSTISASYIYSLSLLQSVFLISSALVISHPFDTLLTNFYHKKSDSHPNLRIAEIYNEVGFKGLYRGFFERTIVLGGGLLAGLASIYIIQQFQS